MISKDWRNSLSKNLPKRSLSSSSNVAIFSIGLSSSRSSKVTPPNSLSRFKDSLTMEWARALTENTSIFHSTTWQWATNSTNWLALSVSKEPTRSATKITYQTKTMSGFKFMEKPSKKSRKMSFRSVALFSSHTKWRNSSKISANYQTADSLRSSLLPNNNTAAATSPTPRALWERPTRNNWLSINVCRTWSTKKMPSVIWTPKNRIRSSTKTKNWRTASAIRTFLPKDQTAKGQPNM